MRSAIAGIHPTIPVELSIDRNSLGQFLTAAQKAANIKINVETKEAVASVIALRDRLAALSKSLASIELTADDTKGRATVARFQAQIAALAGKLTDLQITADDTKAVARITSLQAQIEHLVVRMGNMTADVDIRAAVAQIAALRAELDLLIAKREEVRVGISAPGLAALENQLLGLEADALKLKTPIEIPVGTDAAPTEASLLRLQLLAQDLTNRLYELRIGATDINAVATVAKLQAQMTALTSKIQALKIGVDVEGYAAAEAKLLSIKAATKNFGAAVTGADGAVNRFNGRIGRFGIGLLTATVPLFAGAAAVTGFHLALDTVVELLAVVVPAVITAAAGLGAFAIAAFDSAKQVYQMVTAIHTVGDAMNATIPPMTGKLEALHNQVRPQVWQLYGDAIAAVHTKTGLFNTLATQTGSVLDTLAARITVLATRAGPGLTTFLAAGKRDLAEFGRIALSLGSAFGKLIQITEKTHIAQYLLDIVGAAAKLFEIITKLPIPLLAVVVGLHGLYLWGGLAATGVVKLVTALARMSASAVGLKAANTALGGLGKNAGGAERLGAAIATMGNSFKLVPTRIGLLGLALKGLFSNPWTWAVIGVAAITALVIWSLRAKDATDKWIESSKRLVATSTLYNAVNTTAGQLAATTRRLANEQVQWNASITRAGGVLGKSGHDFAALTQYHKELTQQLVTETGRLGGLAHQFGTTLPGAMALATFAGVKLSDLTSKSNVVWATAVQKIAGVVAGYKAMGQGSGQLGNDINAINVAASDQAKAITQLNTAWDSFIKIVGAPVDTFLTFSQTLVRFGNDATVAGAKITGLGSGIIGVSKKVTNSSIQLQQDFQASFEAANQLFDAMRSAQAPADQQIKAVKDTVATLIPLAGTSKVAAAEISALAQEAGGPATTNLKTLQKWAGVTAKQGMKGLQGDTNKAAIAMSNLSEEAAKLSSTLQKDLVTEESKAIENAVGLQGAMNKYTKSLRENGATSSATQKDRLQLFNDLMQVFHNAKQANSVIDTLSGAFTGNAAAANKGHGARQTLYQDFIRAHDTAKTANGILSAYSATVLINGKNSDAAKAARNRLIGDLEKSGVNADTAKKIVSQYTNSILTNGKDADSVRGARQRLISDILTASGRAKQGKTDMDKLSDAVRNHGNTSDRARTARQRLIADLERAANAHTATGLVNGLSTSISRLPKNPNVVIHMRGDGKYTITGAGPRAIPNGPAQLRPLAAGGKIPGQGNGDTVPALLTPGEVVVPKGMVKAGAVDHLRGRLPGFAGGGLVTNMVPGTTRNILPVAMYQDFSTSMIKSLTRAMTDSINKAAAAAKAASIFGSHVPNVGSGVARWRGLVVEALSMEHLDPSLVANVLYQMQTESGGNPNAINNSDINAQHGDPSRGLMQTIGATFRAFHWPGTSNNIYDPLANIAAALNYARHTYGPNLANRSGGIGSGHGYGYGGLVADSGTTLSPGWNTRYNGTGKPEPLVPAPSGGGMSSGEAAIVAALKENTRAVREQAMAFGRVLSGTASKAASRGYYS